MTEDSDHIDRITKEVATALGGVFDPEVVRPVVAESYSRLAGSAKVSTFLPVLAGRFAKERLRALAQAEDASAPRVPEVLFICLHNAGRSQAAAALLAHHAEGRVHVRSAGSAPTDEVNPSIRSVLEERGLDISRAFPKPLTDEVTRAADVIVSMGCGDACKIYPGKRYLDWELEDPAGKSVDEVRPIVDDIERRVRDLLAELDL